jgi:ribosome-associated protein
MRDIDPAPIRAQLERWADAPNAEKARLRALEHWRERLLAEHGALDRLYEERPGIDRARFAALVEAALAERMRAQPPRAYRELFRALAAVFPAPG